MSTASVAINQFDDPEIAAISAAEHRIVLTRDIGLLKRGNVKLGHWLRSQDPEEQLVELMDRYLLDLHLKPFSRCMKCNGQLREITVAHS